jgi:hypothetical protein
MTAIFAWAGSGSDGFLIALKDIDLLNLPGADFIWSFGKLVYVSRKKVYIFLKGLSRVHCGTGDEDIF